MSRAATLLAFGCILPLLTEAAYSSVYVSYGYGYYGYYSGDSVYSTYSSYVSIGAIVGSVIGALTFIATVVGIIICVCCVRRRRMLAAQRAVQVPMPTMAVPGPQHIATVSGNGVIMYPKQEGAPMGYAQPPPPYPTAYEWGANSNCYQPGTPYPANAGAAPYSQQPPMAYPPPAYQPGVPQAEQRF